jgi:hypothetical protein
LYKVMRTKLFVLAALFAAGCGAKTASPTAPPPTVTALQIVAGQTLLDVGSDARFHATATVSDGSTLNLTNDLNWSSSDSAVADVATDGVVTAVSAGDATISVSWNGLTATTSLRARQTRDGVFVRGRVRDFQSRKVLSGIPVQLDGVGSATTDADGVYSAWLNVPGPATAIVGTTHHNMIVTTGRFDADLLVDTENTCVARYGRVIDETTGQPVAGALLRLMGQEATSSTDGSYRLQVTCTTNSVGFNTTLISVSRPGYTPIGRTVGRGVQRVSRLDIALTRSAQ